jgi:hypothetical protein
MPGQTPVPAWPSTPARQTPPSPWRRQTPALGRVAGVVGRAAHVQLLLAAAAPGAARSRPQDAVGALPPWAAQAVRSLGRAE